MSQRAASLLGVFGTTDFLMPLVLGDLTDEEARTRSRGQEGPSIAWMVGHLLYYRHASLSLLGAGGDNPYQERFGNVPASDGSDYPPIQDLLGSWMALAEPFHEAVASASDQALDAPVDSLGHDESSVMDRLTFNAFHEGYHLGALGALRKALGKPGPAEKVMALMAGEG